MNAANSADQCIEALVVHRIPGRLRLRLPAMRGDAGYFARLRADLDAALPDHGIVVCATTGSVLVTGSECPLTELERIGRERGWFELGAADRAPSAAAAAPGAASALVRDIRGTTILLLLLLASVQLLRGQVLVPATSLLWYAYAVSAGFLPNSSS